MNQKIIISAVSLVLMVGVIIGIAVVVNTNKSSDNNDAKIKVNTNNKYIIAMCQSTDYQTLCHDTFSSMKGANESDPKAYMATSVKAAADTVIKALNTTYKILVDHGNKDSVVNMALKDCQVLLQFAMESLDLTANVIRDNNIYSIHAQRPDLRNWLSAVISYQQTCLHNFDDSKAIEKEIKDMLQGQNLDDVVKSATVALDIVTDLAKIVQQFGLKLDNDGANPTSRRLLGGGVEVDSEGLPTWFSVADRKLLGVDWRANIKPNVVVAKDGSGQFKTIMDAVNSYPKGHKGRYVIYVKAGIYDEYNITVPSSAENILMYGDGPTRTIVTGRKNVHDRLVTTQTASLANDAKGFVGRDMTFENIAGPKGDQAVALRNQGDMSAFVGCHILGYQDTLFAQSHRQLYKDCVISGTIDFIFGISTTVIQDSKIVVRKPLDNQINAVTADGSSERNMVTGIVIQNCQIVAEPALYLVRKKIKSYLGRPWKNYATTVVMESDVGDLIDPAGWYPWNSTNPVDKLYYAEYGNTGAGASVQGRIKWKGYRGVISKAEATLFTIDKFLKATPNSTAVDWLTPLEIPFYPGFAQDLKKLKTPRS